MKRLRRIKVVGVSAAYHAMSRTVGNAFLFEDREKEMLRKMIWQVADFCVILVVWCAAAWGSPDLIDAFIYYLSDGFYKT